MSYARGYIELGMVNDASDELEAIGWDDRLKPQVLLRAVGPTLDEYGVTGFLENPKLTLISGGVEVASNDDWSSNTDLNGLKQTAKDVGAFGLLDGSKDAALIAELQPGAYSAKVEGVGETTGVCLVEVYWVE